MRTDTLDGMYPYAPRSTDVPGFPMHYMGEDPANSEVILYLHGRPTWGFLLRHLIAALRCTHYMVMPDHIGFDKSGTSLSHSYWPQDYIDDLERFVLALDLRDLTLVMHGFGGPVGTGLVSRHPDHMRCIVSVNGPTPFGQATLNEHLAANATVSPWFQQIVRAEFEGRLGAVSGKLGFNTLNTLKLNGFRNHGLINDAWLQTYSAHFATPTDYAGTIGWAKDFATGAHRFELPDTVARRTIVIRPAIAIWGMADCTLHTEYFLPLFSKLFPDALVHRLPGVGHYSLEDAPDTVADRIAASLAQT